MFFMVKSCVNSGRRLKVSQPRTIHWMALEQEKTVDEADIILGLFTVFCTRKHCSLQQSTRIITTDQVTRMVELLI